MKFACLFGATLLAVALPISAGHAATLSVCVEGSPDIFNPQLSSSGTTTNVLGNIYDNLVSVKANSSKIEPVLTTSWEISEARRRYVFTLREGAGWLR